MALKIDWSDDARADIRALDRTTAMFVFDGVLRYATSGHGDVISLHGAMQGRLRLRVGDYRVTYEIGDGIRIVRVNRVRHRRKVYR